MLLRLLLPPFRAGSRGAPWLAGAALLLLGANSLAASADDPVCGSEPAGPAPLEAPRPSPPREHPGVTHHGLYPNDQHDHHHWSLSRHQSDKLAGTSRASLAASVLGVEPLPSVSSRRAERSDATLRERIRLQSAAARAWSQLRQGSPGARESFAALARGPAVPAATEVGLGLAHAREGELVLAVAAMRRAVALDGDRLRCAPINEPLARQVRALLARVPGTSADGAFLHSVLHLLLGELPESERALARAWEAGDRSPAASRLHALLARSAYAPL